MILSLGKTAQICVEAGGCGRFYGPVFPWSMSDHEPGEKISEAGHAAGIVMLLRFERVFMPSVVKERHLTRILLCASAQK